MNPLGSECNDVSADAQEIANGPPTIKDEIINKLQEQNMLLKERLVKEESTRHAFEQDLERERKRALKKKKANRQLKE